MFGPPKPRARYVRLSAEDRRFSMIEAALAGIAEGGIRAFTVDNICERASVSRGLITHYFGTMNALLAALYSHIYKDFLPDAEPASVLTLLDRFFAPQAFNRKSLNVWLTLWSEISNTPELRSEHSAQYLRYHSLGAQALRQSSPHSFDADALAASLICLVDGLGLQHCIDPDTMPASRARQSCLALIEPYTGPLA